MPKFSLPKEVQIPEGIAAGDKFQVMATLELGDDGMVELCEVDGNAVEKGEDKKETTESEDGSFVTQVMGYGRKGM